MHPDFIAALRSKKKLCAALLAVLAITTLMAQPARTENPEVAARQSADRTLFSDAEIRDGFFKTAFRAELQFGPAAGRIRKFDDPIRLYVANLAAPDRSTIIESVVANIRAHVAHLDLAVTTDPKTANFVVLLVETKNFARTLRVRYGADAAKTIQRKLRPYCLSGIAKDESFRIRRAEAVLPADAEDFDFYDCAYEEILQGLGLINDDGSVPWTMFNDQVQMGFFDTYDQYLVNILYDPRIRAGMTERAVDAILPDVLRTARARVAGPRQAEVLQTH